MRNAPLAQLVAERIHRLGPLPFQDFVDLALYAPEGGFYTRGGRAGRQGDFVTSPELGPLFAAVLARAVDGWWDDLGRPDPFVVVEAGAGRGQLARDFIAARPRCLTALRYVLVERSETLRAAHADGLPLELPAFVLGPVSPSEGAEDEPQAVAGRGPLATSLAELPAEPVASVVVANELLDNLPFRLLAWTGPAWSEVLVGEEGDGFGEVLVPASPEVADEAERLAPAAPADGRIPLQHRAQAWLRAALAIVPRGRVMVFDYADVTSSLARRPQHEWLRTYRLHGRGSHPLDDPGSQDITCEVAVDQLARVRPPSMNRSQADFLRAHGLDALVASARDAWHERAAVGDLEAMRARSRVTEGRALTDATGLGGFRALEWVIPPPAEPGGTA